MKNITIYHNSRCSKSRQTLAILEEHKLDKLDINIINYLENPPSINLLKTLLKQLQLTARDIIRTKEAEYKELNLNDTSLTEQQLLTAIHQHPKLLERPIVVFNDKAVIGRPPENVLALIQ